MSQELLDPTRCLLPIASTADLILCKYLGIRLRLPQDCPRGNCDKTKHFLSLGKKDHLRQALQTLGK